MAPTATATVTTTAQPDPGTLCGTAENPCEVMLHSASALPVYVGFAIVITALFAILGAALRRP